MAYQALTLERAAALLNCDENELRHLALTGEIPCQRQGDKMFLDQEWLCNWWSAKLLNGTAARLQRRPTRQPPAALLSSSLCSAEWITTSLPGKSKPAVLRALASLAEKSGRLYCPDDFYEGLRRREALASTALPGGVALVHPDSRDEYQFESSFICLGISGQPVFFGEADGKATDVFFVIACKDDLHLQVLARLSELCARPAFLADLRQSENGADALAVWRQAEAALNR